MTLKMTLVSYCDASTRLSMPFLACPGCKHHSQLDAQITLQNLFKILGILEKESDAELFSKAFKEASNFFYCKNSTTTCANFKEISDDDFQKIVFGAANSFKSSPMIHHLILPIHEILDGIVEVIVCEISDNNCEKFLSEDYNVDFTANQVLKSLRVGQFLLDMIHNRVIRARCSLECKPF